MYKPARGSLSEKIIQHIQRNGSLHIESVADEWACSRKTLVNRVSQLQSEGVLERCGRATYRLSEDSRESMKQDVMSDKDKEKRAEQKVLHHLYKNYESIEQEWEEGENTYGADSIKMLGIAIHSACKNGLLHKTAIGYELTQKAISMVEKEECELMRYIPSARQLPPFRAITQEHIVDTNYELRRPGSTTLLNAKSIMS